MMPPSRCWTVWRLLSGLTIPGAMAAPESGAVAAQTPPTTKNSARADSPRAREPRTSAISGGGGAAASSGRGAGEPGSAGATTSRDG